MGADHALERIVIVPVNGYVNRLQAWASASIIGAELDVPVQVLWEPEPIAAAPAEALFTPQRVRMSFVEAPEVTGLLGSLHRDLPRYLTVDRGRRLVFLAGHDRGEQVFMGELVEALRDPSRPTSLVIVAGGTFSLPGTEDASEQRRRAFYRQIDWHPMIEERVAAVLDDREPFVGLHIRGTDRSRQAPTTRALTGALRSLSKDTGLTSVFIAADSASARHDWVSRVDSLGLLPWTIGDIDFDRSEAAAGIDAIVDWIVLGRSHAIIYSASSSFGSEAALATNSPAGCLALEAPPTLVAWRAASHLAQSASGYPRRRLSR